MRSTSSSALTKRIANICSSQYMVSKVPALGPILEWAETCDLGGYEFLHDDIIKAAIGNVLSDSQIGLLNSSMWGFLSTCVNGDAENVFEAAGQNAAFTYTAVRCRTPWAHVLGTSPGEGAGTPEARPRLETRRRPLSPIWPAVSTGSATEMTC